MKVSLQRCYFFGHESYENIEFDSIEQLKSCLNAKGIRKMRLGFQGFWDDVHRLGDLIDTPDELEQKHISWLEGHREFGLSYILIVSEKAK